MKIKKLFVSLISIALLCGCAGLFSACKEENDVDPNEETEATVLGLTSAYEQGYLTREDLMNISYFYCGSVIAVSDENCTGNASERNDGIYVNGELIEPEELDFAPTAETPALTDELQEELITAYYNANKKSIEENHGSKSDIFVKKYLGEYSGHYVAVFKDFSADVGEVEVEVYVGGVKFVYGNPSLDIKVVI